MVLIHPWNPGTCYVKVAWFFREEHGDTQEWGKSWKPVKARSDRDARERGLRKYPKGTYTNG